MRICTCSLRGETVRYHRLSHKNQALLCWWPSQPQWLRDTSGCTLKLHPPRSRVIPCPAISPLMSLKYSQLSQDLHDWLGYCAWRKPRKTCCMSAVQRRDSQLPWSEVWSVFKNNTKKSQLSCFNWKVKLNQYAQTLLGWFQSDWYSLHLTNQNQFVVKEI